MPRQLACGPSDCQATPATTSHILGTSATWQLPHSIEPRRGGCVPVYAVAAATRVTLTLMEQAGHCRPCRPTNPQATLLSYQRSRDAILRPADVASGIRLPDLLPSCSVLSGGFPRVHKRSISRAQSQPVTCMGSGMAGSNVSRARSVPDHSGRSYSMPRGRQVIQPLGGPIFPHCAERELSAKLIPRECRQSREGGRPKWLKTMMNPGHWRGQ